MTPQRITIPSVRKGDIPALVLDPRLGAALDFLRGGVMADVGTDHAYLPIAALQRGLAIFAIATDIHKGPAEVAAAHLAANGLGEDRAAVLLTDGLHGAEGYRPTDVCIFGMGGEMIARIIDEAPWVRDSSVRLILQPMTKQDVLRDYLARNGFCVVCERLIKTDRIYTLLCAEFDGQARSLSPLERLIGKDNLERGDALTREWICRHVEILTATRKGKQKGNAPDTSREDALIFELTRYLEQHTED
jgi:tRNA (adenine22-N1)-methyltransferase